MTDKTRNACVENFPANEQPGKPPQTLRLISGRKVQISSRKDGDLVEIYEPEGHLAIRVELTESGPVMKVEGCKLELKGSESISLRAPAIDISADEKTRLSSKGELEIDAVKEMGLHSDDDIRVVGKIIHLN